MDSGRLQQLYASALTRPMVWGEDDCVLFAADVASCYLGYDPIVRMRGRWHDEWSAKRFRIRGGRSYEMAYRRLAPLYGLRQIPVEEAVPGDVGLVEDASRQRVAAARVEQGWVARGPVGFAVFKSAVLAWRSVGRAGTRDQG